MIRPSGTNISVAAVMLVISCLTASAAGLVILGVVNGSGSGSYTVGKVVAISAYPAPAGQAFCRWWSVDSDHVANIHDPDTTEDAYRQVIYRKTARLFEAGALIAAVLASRSEAEEAAMIEYGQNLGTAFQLVDDALDFDASPEELGKNLGDDLAEGKATLPLIHAMRQGNREECELIRNAILEGGLTDLWRIQSVIESTGALQYTAARAQEAADLAIGALSGIPDSDFKQALIAIAEFSVRRRF